MMQTTGQEELRGANPYLSKPSGEIVPLEDLMDYVRQYARQKPETFGLWCLGIGFVLGWRLKPW